MKGSKWMLWGGTFVSLLALVLLGGFFLLKWKDETSIQEFQHEEVISRHEAAEEIDLVAKVLVDRWFQYFTSPEVKWGARLQSYRLDEVQVATVRDQLIVSVTAQVQPTRWSFDNWLAGSGGTVSGRWIHGKFIRFALDPSPEGYRLHSIGTGPY